MSAIGIDLGTTFSCVAIYENGHAEILPNKLGNRATPCCVSFSDRRRLIGEAAAIKALSNPTNTIFDAKRIIGRKFNNPIVQNGTRNWPFKVVNEDGKPMLEVKHKGELKKVSPVEISAAVLYEMKSIAEAYLGKPISKAVITVPAHFNNSQRQATKDAGEIAGLDVMRILNEPTAAAIAYGLYSETRSRRRSILVYDLGGGAFDVTILVIEDGVFSVKSTAGDTHLGGQDFTSKIVDHFCDKIMKNHNYDIKKDPKAMGQLRQECEKAKIRLSAMDEAPINIDMLYGGKDFHDKITRDLFEELIVIEIHKTLEVVYRALNYVKMKPEDIDEIVLIGGSTRIPIIRNLIQDLFRKLPHNINPVEAVATGAAIWAAKLAEKPEELQEIVVRDVASLSLGMKGAGGLMSVIIPRNTTFPTKISRDVSIPMYNQTAISISIFEGESDLIRDNELFGKFILDGIPPQKRQTLWYNFTSEINSDGMLSVWFTEKSGGQEKLIIQDKIHLPINEIERLKGVARVYLEDEKAEDERVEAKIKVEAMCFEKKSEIIYGDAKNVLSEQVKEEIKSECNTMLKWLEENEAATKEDYESQLHRLTRTIQPLFK